MKTNKMPKSANLKSPSNGNLEKKTPRKVSIFFYPLLSSLIFNVVISSLIIGML
jgi:hypothetical protein